MMPEWEEYGSKRELVQSKRKGFWSRRSGLEKGLVAALGVCGLVLVAGGLFAATNQKGEGRHHGHHDDKVFTKDNQDVCVTPECAIAASNIIQTMDINADPCDDFFRFACGGWIDNNVIPDRKSKWGIFYELRDQLDRAIKKVVESPKTPEDPKSVGYLKDLFGSCTDTDAIEESGLKDIVARFGPEGEDGGWPMILDSWQQEKFNAEKTIGEARRYMNEAWGVNLFVYMDDLNTDRNIISLDQPSLGLPHSMYLDEVAYKDYITAYKAFMFETAEVLAREVGSKVTQESLGASVEAVFQLEVGIAKIMTPESERRNTTAMYNPMTVTQLKENYGVFDWTTYFSSVFTETDITIGDDETVIVVQPDYFAAMQTVDPKALANYLYWRAIMSLAPLSTSEMRDINFKFTAVMTGVETAPPRWSTCVSSAVGKFGFAAAHEYIKDHLPDSSKVLADSMVNDLRAAFKELVEETDWMDPDTQTVAKEKADLLLQLIGYPDWLPDGAQLDEYYSGVEAPEGTYLRNVVSMAAWESLQELKTLRETPQRDIWLMHPAIVNAWYSPNHNSITFPAGILQPPFFAGGYPRYLNYGAMGVVIGHEITHGFDDQGRQYDGTGNAKPWWSDSTIAAFSEKAQCFIDQYGNYTVPELIDILGEEDAHLNGKNTQGENVADNGGVHESFRAYMNSVAQLGPEPALPGLTQFTPDQMFFVSFSQVWCEIATTENLLNQVLGDPHSPGKFRVWGPLSNSPDFVREWNCPAGSNMNRDDKCALW